MTSSLECTLDWLQLKLPNLPALASGFSLGTLGVASLGLIIGALAPASLVLWLPLVLLLCGASAGYKFWEKRQAGSQRPFVIALCLGAGLLTGASASVLQLIVDAQLFQATTSLTIVGLFLVCGLIGAGLGGLLRDRYEKIHHSSPSQ